MFNSMLKACVYAYSKLYNNADYKYSFEDSSIHCIHKPCVIQYGTQEYVDVQKYIYSRCLSVISEDLSVILNTFLNMISDDVLESSNLHRTDIGTATCILSTNTSTGIVMDHCSDVIFLIHSTPMQDVNAQLMVAEDYVSSLAKSVYLSNHKSLFNKDLIAGLNMVRSSYSGKYLQLSTAYGNVHVTLVGSKDIVDICSESAPSAFVHKDGTFYYDNIRYFYMVLLLYTGLYTVGKDV